MFRIREFPARVCEVTNSLSSVLVIAPLLIALTGCSTNVIVPTDDLTDPKVTLRQVVPTGSPVLMDTGSPYNEDVSKRSRLVLVGKVTDTDGGAQSVEVSGSFEGSCVDYKGTSNNSESFRSTKPCSTSLVIQ